jgi:hypothetical protein
MVPKPPRQRHDTFALVTADPDAEHEDTEESLAAALRAAPALAQQRLEHGAGDLVRITLKRAYADGTVAVEMDPLSLLCRLATSVPPPRFHTVKYAGVLAPASPWRSRIAPPRKPPLRAAETQDEELLPKHAGTYRAWAELLKGPLTSTCSTARTATAA